MPLKLIVLACLGLAVLIGCKRANPPACQGDDCKYLYERKVQGISTEQVPVKQSDFVVILFSATGNKLFLESHNFAIFAKVRSESAEDFVTISWMPKSMKAGRGIEAGINLDLPTTLAWAATNNAKVERYGPFYCTEDLFRRAKTQVDKLAAGSIQYKLIDGNLRPDTATNSVHAISDILCNGDRFDKLLIQTGMGKEASAALKVYFEKEGYLDGKYKNDGDLLRQFNLQHIKRLD